MSIDALARLIDLVWTYALLAACALVAYLVLAALVVAVVDMSIWILGRIRNAGPTDAEESGR